MFWRSWSQDQGLFKVKDALRTPVMKEPSLYFNKDHENVLDDLITPKA